MNLKKYFIYSKRSRIAEIVTRNEFFMSFDSKILKKINRGIILDFGCGKGNYLRRIKKINPSLILFGCDQGNILEDREGITFVRYKHRANTKIPFNNNKFDFVSSIDVLEHFTVEEIDSFISELRRILKPTGILYIKVPHFSYLKHGYFFDDPTHVRPYTKVSLLRLAEMYEFQVIKYYRREKKHLIFIIPLIMLSIFKPVYRIYWQGLLFGYSNYVFYKKI